MTPGWMVDEIREPVESKAKHLVIGWVLNPERLQHTGEGTVPVRGVDKPATADRTEDRAIAAVRPEKLEGERPLWMAPHFQEPGSSPFDRFWVVLRLDL